MVRLIFAVAVIFASFHFAIALRFAEHWPESGPTMSSVDKCSLNGRM